MCYFIVDDLLFAIKIVTIKDVVTYSQLNVKSGLLKWSVTENKMLHMLHVVTVTYVSIPKLNPNPNPTIVSTCSYSVLKCSVTNTP